MPYTTDTTHSAFVTDTATPAYLIRVVPATNLVISNNNILDSSVTGTVVGTMSATFLYGSTGVQWSLTNSAGGKYAIDSNTGIVTVAGALTVETDTIGVQVTQSGKAAASANISINVALETIATNIVFNPASLTDLASIGTILGTASTTDGQSYVWSLPVNPGGRWAINSSTGVVTVATGLIADTETIDIQITFGTKSYMQAFSITIVAPTISSITLPLSTVYTNEASGTQVAQASVTGTNLGPVTYSIPSGQDAGGMFAINSGGVLSVGSTTLVAGSQTIQITATPAGGNAYTQSFTVTVQAAISGFQILSYSSTATTNNSMGLTGTYTGGTAPSAPGAYWSGGVSATVNGWTAANGRWSCALTTPSSATGSLTFSIGGLTSNTAVAVSAAPLDLAPGISFPTEIVLGAATTTGNAPGNDTALGSWLLRGFIGGPTLTLSDTVSNSGDSANFWLDTVNSQLKCNGTAPGNSTKSSWAVDITASDGVLTSVVHVTINNPAAATPYYCCAGNFILDSASPYTGSQYSFGSVIVNGSSVSVTDSANVVQWDATHSVFYITSAHLNSYGVYPVTITVNGTTTYSTTFFIGHERPPSAVWVPAINVFNNTPTGSIIGTINYHGDVMTNSRDPANNNLVTAFVMVLQPATNPSPGVLIGYDGVVTLAGIPSSGNLVFGFSIGGNVGTTSLSVTIPVATGTTLSSTNISYGAIPAIDNSMAWLPLPGGIAASPLLITTLSVTGFTNTPTWTIEVTTASGQPDNAQDNIPTGLRFFGNHMPPRYTFAPMSFSGLTWSGTATTTTTGTSGINLYGAYFSAQTDHVYLTADDGQGTRCQVMLPIAVSAKSGPSIDVGPSQTYTTVNALLIAWWANRSAFNGAVVTLHPGIDATTDLNYQNQSTASGYLRGWWPGPVTLQSPSGSVRTVLNFGTNTIGNGQGGIMSANFDMTLINLEISNVSTVGQQGSPNSAGIWMNALLPGNLTVNGCYLHNCDMGIANGDGAPRHVILENCIFNRNGTGSGPGSDHNIYISTIASLTVTNTQSDNSSDDHCLKSRAMVTTVSNSKFRQGVQCVGAAAGVPIDICVGGIVSISNCVVINSANPDNNGLMLHYASEIGVYGGAWPSSSLSVSNNTFYNICGPAVLTSAVVPIQTDYIINPTDGGSLVATYANNQFYNVPHAEWAQGNGFEGSYPGWKPYYGANVPPTDGGGNTALTTYTHQQVIDPLTSIEPIHPPTTGTPGDASVALYTADSFVLDYVMATAPASATTACVLVPYDVYCNVMTSVTYSLLNSAGGHFSCDTSGNITTATSSTPDGIYFIQLQSTGTGRASYGSTYSSITVSPQWVPIIVGNGFVAAS